MYIDKNGNIWHDKVINKWSDWNGGWGKPWSAPYEYPFIPTKIEKPKVDTIERFVVEYNTNSMVLRGNLPGFAKTNVNVFFENGKLNVVTSGGGISYSVDCSAQIYNWQSVTSSYFEGRLVVEVKKHPKISDRMDVKL